MFRRRNEPVPTISYTTYQTFARSVGKAARLSGSGVLSQEEKQQLIDKYKGWGCEEAILRRILVEVFSTDLEKPGRRACKAGAPGTLPLRSFGDPPRI